MQPAAAPAPLVVRAWRDPLFRALLDDRDRARLPEHPAGVLTVDDLPED